MESQRLQASSAQRLEHTTDCIRLKLFCNTQHLGNGFSRFHSYDYDLAVSYVDCQVHARGTFIDMSQLNANAQAPSLRLIHLTDSLDQRSIVSPQIMPCYASWLRRRKALPHSRLHTAYHEPSQ